MFQTVPVLGYNVAIASCEEAAQWCLKAIKNERPQLLVTLNPEIIIQAESKPELKATLQRAELTVADGVGVVWAAKQAGYRLPERVPGVELVGRVLELGGQDLRVFFLGAKPGIAEKAALEAQRRFGIQIAGIQHGYFDREKESEQICQQVCETKPDLLLAGLGEGQELFLDNYRNTLNVPLMIGVGGTLDVLSGEVKRTPAWTHKWGLEWAYRVGLDPKRWHRFPRLLRFMQLVLVKEIVNR